MRKSAQQVAGNKLRFFIRDVVTGEPGIGKLLANRIADRLVGSIDRLVELHAELTTVRPERDTGPERFGSVFDPYAFGAVVTLVRSGREALLARLAEIDNVDHLRQLADAQHLGLDPDLTQIDDVRRAIVAGAEARLANRFAAGA